MKTPKQVVELTQRIELALSKSRSSLSTDDVFLLEKCIFFLQKMRKTKSDKEKKEFLAKGIACWTKFLAKNETLMKYSALFNMLDNNTE
jgi:hypothetical protein